MKRIDAEMLEKFKNCIEKHLGLCVRPEDGEALRKILTVRMKKLNIAEPEEYFFFLESSAGQKEEEWKRLILPITTGESYFFRDKGHFFLLKNIVLPELLKKNEDRRSLSIWSAGCSTGEEPYSIAILIDMLLPDVKRWNISILGTDINEESLKKAERGNYSDWSFRLVDKNIQQKYFKRHGDEWQIDVNIKNMVKFQYENLMDSDLILRNPEIRDIDIIICRNVFIYFEKEAVSKVLSKFIKRLNNAGYLFTGHGELQGHDLMDLRQIMYPEAVIYKKTEELKVRPVEIAKAPERRKKIKNITATKKPVSGPIVPSRHESLMQTQDPIPEIEKLFKKGLYSEAVDKIESLSGRFGDRYDFLFMMAQAHANSGDYEKAESVCRKAMNINADSADPYFLLAHIEEARGNDEEAKNLFRKVIYLDPACIAAYCELGGLYEKENDFSRAKKNRITAIELLKPLPSQSCVKPYDITARELLEYLESMTRSTDTALMPVKTLEKKG